MSLLLNWNIQAGVFSQILITLFIYSFFKKIVLPKA